MAPIKTDPFLKLIFRSGETKCLLLSAEISKLRFEWPRSSPQDTGDSGEEMRPLCRDRQSRRGRSIPLASWPLLRFLQFYASCSPSFNPTPPQASFPASQAAISCAYFELFKVGEFTLLTDKALASPVSCSRGAESQEGKGWTIALIALACRILLKVSDVSTRVVPGLHGRE